MIAYVFAVCSHSVSIDIICPNDMIPGLNHPQVKTACTAKKRYYIHNLPAKLYNIFQINKFSNSKKQNTQRINGASLGLQRIRKIKSRCKCYLDV